MEKVIMLDELVHMDLLNKRLFYILKDNGFVSLNGIADIISQENNDICCDKISGMKRMSGRWIEELKTLLLLYGYDVNCLGKPCLLEEDKEFVLNGQYCSYENVIEAKRKL